MKIALIDNYDSFTYNLVEVIRQNSPEVEVTVFRNDKISTEELREFDKIILSPGPGVPKDAGIILEVINHYKEDKPILGICLGHQAIGQAFGAELINIEQVMHGIQSEALHVEHAIFAEVPETIRIGRYHSWIIDEETCPDSLKIIARSSDGQIMGVAHESYDIIGLQFHPESVMTPEGSKMLKNFIKL